MGWLNHAQFPTSGATPTAETVIATSPVLSVGAGQVKAIVRGVLNVVAGAAGAMTVRIRQGTTTAGALLATAIVTGVSAADACIVFDVEDPSNWLEQAPGGQYCITFQTGTAATYVGGAWSVETFGG